MKSRTVLTGISAFVMSIYVVLVVASLICATSHAGHHGHDSGHSPLCAWACQANNSVGVVALPIPALPIFLAIALLSLLYNQSFSAHRIRLASRGPPAS